MLHLLYIAIIVFLLTDNKETKVLTSAATCACKVTTIDTPNRVTAQVKEETSDNVEAISKCEFVKFTTSEETEMYCDNNYVYFMFRNRDIKTYIDMEHSYADELKETRKELYACKNGQSDDKIEEQGEGTDE